MLSFQCDGGLCCVPLNTYQCLNRLFLCNWSKGNIPVTVSFGFWNGLQFFKYKLLFYHSCVIWWLFSVSFLKQTYLLEHFYGKEPFVTSLSLPTASHIPTSSNSSWLFSSCPTRYRLTFSPVPVNHSLLPFNNPFPYSPSHLTFPPTCSTFLSPSALHFHEIPSKISMCFLPFLSIFCNLLPETWNLILVPSLNVCLIFWILDFLPAPLDWCACLDCLPGLDPYLPASKLVLYFTLAINTSLNLSVCLHLGQLSNDLNN